MSISIKRTPARISRAIKLRVWETYVGSCLRARCASCDANIDVLDFACGRVICAQNGGAATVENLRPVCCACEEFLRARDLYDARKFARPPSIPIEGMRFKFPVAATPFSTPATSDASSDSAPDEPPPTHFKSHRHNVSKSIRAEVWDTYMGNVPRGLCSCCKKDIIARNKFKCKRVVDDGAITVANLRPVCSSCIKKIAQPGEAPSQPKTALERWTTQQIARLCHMLDISAPSSNRAACIEQICARNYVLPRATPYSNADEARALIADIESRALLRALFGGAKRANLGMLKRFALTQLGISP